jgi:secondary thiamine-phosphate synthase enzyme
MIEQYEIEIPEFSRGYHLITSYINSRIKQLPEKGLVNLFIKHTSAGITINENADPSVRRDFEVAMNHLVPDGFAGFSHTLEGDDDMPAHVKSTLVGQSLTIPITNRRLNLGTWQGIYLCEFRNYSGPRQLVITVYS